MKKLIIKLFVISIFLVSFTGCYTLLKMYSYSGGPVDYNPQEHYEYRDYIYIYASVEHEGDKNSPISIVEVRPINFANVKKSKKVELLSKEIKAEYNGKRYTLKVTAKTAVLPYKEGIVLKEGTIIYFGKIKVDDNLIIEMPPVKLKQYVKVSKYIPILGGLNIDTKEEIYYGRLEDYKGR